MADTIRSQDYFLNSSTGAFKDNTTGLITAQALRDLVKSVQDATELQRNAANAALSMFDWSQMASDNWNKGKRRQNAIALLNSTEPSMMALRALARVVQSRMSVLLTALGRTPLSTAQLVSMWADEIVNGQVDDSLPG